MRKLLLLCFLPACVIDAPTFHGSDGGAEIDASTDADIDATPDAAHLTTADGSHDFSDVPTGMTSSAYSITVTNDGTADSGTISVTLGGSAPGQFDIVDAGADDCDGRVLAPTEHCVAQALFHPSAAGASAATLDVSASPGGTASAALSGNGLSPGSLEITAGATLTFATQEIVSQSTAKTITVHNMGRTATGALSTIVGDTTNYTTLNDSCDGNPLGPNASCSVDVKFGPTTVGSLPSQISIRESPTVGVASSATGTGTARLQVNKSGTGVVSSSPGGINCGNGCATETVSFPQTPVTLTASELSGYAFDAWSGACASANPSTMCTVPLTTPLTTVGVTFLQLFPLDVDFVGLGGVTSAPSGIQCGGGMSDCNESYKSGTMVTLTATPSTDYEVNTWTGAPGCTAGMHSCSVTMSQARSVTVEFKRQYTVTVIPGGSGTGTITGGAINCPGVCTAKLFTGSLLTLTEAPGTAGTNSQMVFGGWSGAGCSGSGTTCGVTVDADRTVNADFKVQHRLEVINWSTGGATGSVTATGGFSCSTTGTCHRYYDQGTVVTVTAKPNNGTNSIFSGFGGTGSINCGEISTTCDVTMTAPLDVSAPFEPYNYTNLVFVSSSVYPANLGSAVAYDAVCNTLATTAGINNATNDRYVAWMSDNNSLAKNRLGSARGFVGMDGAPFFSDLSSVLVNDAAILYPIRYDEKGNDPGSVEFFSGTTIEGNAYPGNCQNWTTLSEDGFPPKGGSGGLTQYGPVGWSGQRSMYCGQSKRLLCFGKSNPYPLDPRGPSDWLKRIYLTNSGYVPGAVSPDAACAASKPAGVGNVHAVIATTTASAASKLDFNAGYERSDGVFIGIGGNILAGEVTSGVWQRGDGTYSEGSFLLGSSQFTQVGTDTCDDWTNPSSATPSWTGTSANIALGLASAQGYFPCSGSLDRPLLCVEE